MVNRIAASVGALLTTMMALTGTAVLRAGAASADPNQDDRFLALLDSKGVSALSGVPNLIATAHQICRNLDAGTPAAALVDALVNNANDVTPGADRDRLVRSEARFLDAAVEAYCPNNLGTVASSIPAGWNKPLRRVVLASLIKETNPEYPTPPGPGPDAQNLTPPQAVAPPPPRKVAPPVVGPPPGGGGGDGGGTGGVAPPPPMEPGIIALAP